MANKKQDWKALQAKTGHAGRIPAQVKLLGSEDFEERREAYRVLKDQLVGKNEWYSASAPAIGLICGSLAKMEEPTYALVLAANIAAGEHSSFWAKADLREANGECVNALRPWVDTFFAYLDGEDQLRRCAATLVLSAALSSKDEAEVGKLNKAYETESDATVKASLLLCLSCLEDVKGTKGRCTPLLQDSSDWLRGTATLCLLSQGAKMDETLTQGVEALLRLPNTDPSSDAGRWPWFNERMLNFSSDHTIHDPSTNGLAAAAEARNPDVRAQLIDCLLAVGENTQSGLCATRAMRLLAAFGGFQKRDAPCLPSQFPPEQWAMAKRLVTSRLCPGSMWGLPAAGVVRRRWAGLDVPRPLDTLVPDVLNPEAGQVPLWYAWIQSRKQAGAALPPILDRTLKGLDRWEALTEFACSPYEFSHIRSTAELEEEFSRLSNDEETMSRVGRLADEQAWRVTNARWQLRYYPGSSTASALLLVPWIRAGRLIPDAWLCLIEVDDYGHCAEILEALPLQQREALALEILKRRLPTGAPDLFQRFIQRLPLLGTPAVVDALRKGVETHEKKLRSNAITFKTALDAHVALTS